MLKSNKRLDNNQYSVNFEGVTMDQITPTTKRPKTIMKGVDLDKIDIGSVEDHIIHVTKKPSLFEKIKRLFSPIKARH